MRKFFQETVYWIGWYTVANKDEKETSLFTGVLLLTIMMLWINVLMITIIIQMFTNISAFDYFDSLLPAVFHDKTGTIGMQKFRVTLYCLPFILLFSYIFYKILFYKTDTQELKAYYRNLPKKRRKKAIWITGIYIFLSIILLPFTFGPMFTPRNNRHQKLKEQAIEQKVDTFYPDRLPADVNFLLPKKDTTKSSNQ